VHLTRHRSLAALVWLRRVVLVVCLGFALALGASTLAHLPVAVVAATAALTEPAVLRLQRASGLGPDLVQQLRQDLAEQDRLVLFSPYGGQDHELDGDDPRGEPARQIRTLFERTKNLLYPRPRDVRFARDAAELLQQLEGAVPGRCFVLDGTQAPVPLAVGGRYELRHVETLGTAQLRLWRWQGAP